MGIPYIINGKKFVPDHIVVLARLSARLREYDGYVAEAEQAVTNWNPLGPVSFNTVWERQWIVKAERGGFYAAWCLFCDLHGLDISPYDPIEFTPLP